MPFIPQILFELKNGFPQSNAIINYFSTGGEGDGLSFEKIDHVIFRLIGENRNIVFTSLPDKNSEILLYIFLTFVFLVFTIFLKEKNYKRYKKFI